MIVGALVMAACSSDDDVSADADPTTSTRSAGTSPSPNATTSPSTPRRSRGDDTTAPTSPTTTEVLPRRCGDDINPSGPVTLRVSHSTSGDVKESYLPAVVERFESQHPEIRVELFEHVLSQPGGVAILFENDAQPPDVVLGTNLTVREQADSGAFLPVVACADGAVPANLDGLLPAVELTYTVDETLWAAPYNVSTPLLMYDGNLWSEAGLDPDDPPTTIDGLLDTAVALDDSGLVETGMVLYDKSALWLLTETAAKQGRLLLEPDNGRTGRVDAINLIDDDVLTLVDELRRMKQEGQIAWAGLNADNRTDLSMLVAPTEQSGLTLHTSASLGDIFRLDDAGALPDVDVRVAPLPGPGPGASPGGGAWWLVDGPDDDRVAAGWEFIRWMSQPEQIAELAAFTGYVPTTVEAAEHPITIASWEEHPQYRVAYEQVAATPSSVAAVGIQVGPMGEVLRAIELGLADSIDRNQEPAASMQAAVESVASVLLAYANT